MANQHTPRADECTQPIENTGPCGVSPRGVRHVLVVDDNVEVARALHDYLALHGCEVRVAHDGPAAVEAARSTPPDVVLLDIGLPGMSGHAVARTLRANPQLARCRIIALTGYVRSCDREHALRSGCDDYLAKPPDTETLVAIVRSPRARAVDSSARGLET